MDNNDTRILIAENDELLGAGIQSLLDGAGYQTRWVNSSFAALAALEGASEAPFAVVISSYRMPRMNGDALLENARIISPDTQRILLIDSLELDTAINAVNRAGIHSCIPVPFQDEILLAEVSQWCEQFNRIQKKASLIKVTRHQNNQLYKIALNLKKKKKVFSQQIREKEARLKALQAQKTSVSIRNIKLRKAETLAETLSFKKLLEMKGHAISQDLLLKEFKSLSYKLKCYLEYVAFDNTDELMDMNAAKFLRAHPEISSRMIDRTLNNFLRQEYLKIEYQLKLKPEDGQTEHRKPGHEKTGCSEAEYQRMDGVKNSNRNKDPGVKLAVVSGDMKAVIELQKPDAVDLLSLEQIKELMRTQGICHGIKEDIIIEEWLASSPEKSYPFVVAHGIEPVFPKNAEIQYHFKVDFLHAGQINEDGSIDFRERGELPFITDKTLLAEKTELIPGKPGIDVYGNTISVPEAEDCLFEAGTNTRFSEDRLKIYATADGQPHLDAMGTLSVCPELYIDGDVDYDTGNINFKGNIIVRGAVKEGFSVRCANLTVDQVHGAEINITGNLNVSSGIIDSNVINVQGNVQAKYINNSRVKAFENVIVQREIIDSHLFAGGECINENGLITSSFINAKRGIRAGRAGTDKAAASRFEVGTEGLMEMLIADLDERVEKNLAAMKLLKQEIDDYEGEEKVLHEKISTAAYVQDRSQVELRKLRNLLPELQASKDIIEVQKALDMLKELQERAEEAEDIINDAFERQDAIVEFIYTRQSKIEKLEQSNEAIVHKKSALKAYNRKSEPRAEVIVRKSIIHDTIISGKRSRLVVKEELQRCKIHEVRTVDKTRYVMRISEL